MNFWTLHIHKNEKACHFIPPSPLPPPHHSKSYHCIPLWQVHRRQWEGAIIPSLFLCNTISLTVSPYTQLLDFCGNKYILSVLHLKVATITHSYPRLKPNLYLHENLVRFLILREPNHHRVMTSYFLFFRYNANGSRSKSVP